MFLIRKHKIHKVGELQIATVIFGIFTYVPRPYPQAKYNGGQKTKKGFLREIFCCCCYFLVTFFFNLVKEFLITFIYLEIFP